MRRQTERGNMIVETALFLPLFLLLIVGLIQFGKMTYVYYQLKKALFTVAQYVARQQGVDFCAESDTTITAAKTLALTGGSDQAAPSMFGSLTTDQIAVTTECVDASGAIGECSLAGCGTSAGGPHPDYIVVSIPSGYQYPLRLPYILLEPVQLFPQARVPFGGT